MVAATGADLLGCRADEADPGSDRDGNGEKGPADAASPSPDRTGRSKTPTAAGSAWLGALQGALGHGIVTSKPGDGTYRVDAFVAVLVFEHLRRTEGKPLFTPITPSGDPAGPSGGYRVGPLEEGSVYHRLGLREADVVESINGVVLEGPERFGFALDGAENRLRLTVYREDFSMTLSYRLTRGQAWSDLLADFTGQDVAPSGTENADEYSAGAVTDPPAPPGGTTNGASSDRATKPAAPARGVSERPSNPTRPRKPARPRSPPRSSKPSSASPVECDSASKCTVAKSHFDELVAAPERLQSQVDIVPAIRNDVHSGYKLKSIKPGSTVARLGFRSDDKLTHVNGYDLTNEAQAMQLYFTLGGSRIFKVRYERSGQRRVKTIVVR